MNNQSTYKMQIVYFDSRPTLHVLIVVDIALVFIYTY